MGITPAPDVSENPRENQDHLKGRGNDDWARRPGFAFLLFQIDLY